MKFHDANTFRQAAKETSPYWKCEGQRSDSFYLDLGI